MGGRIQQFVHSYLRWSRRTKIVIKEAMIRKKEIEKKLTGSSIFNTEVASSFYTY